MNIDPLKPHTAPAAPGATPAAPATRAEFERAASAPAGAPQASGAPAPFGSAALERVRAALQSCPPGQDPHRHVLQTVLKQQFEALEYHPAPEAVDRLANGMLNDPTLQLWLSNLIRAAGAGS